MAIFPTHAVLSLATGTLMGEFSAMHALLEHYAGGPVWMHQIPQVTYEAKACARATLGAAFEPFDRDVEGWETYRNRMVAKLGETIEVAAPEKPFHRADAVLADAVEAMGGDASRVILAKADGEIGRGE